MANLYQVVDDDDLIIGHKRREDIDWKKDIYRIAALWLINSKNQVLIAKRVDTKDKDPGKWGPSAAGTMEENEDYDTNIYKEAEEELGLTGVEFTKSIKQRFHEPREAFCQWFIGYCDKQPSEFSLQADEVDRVEWVDIDWLRRDAQSHPDKYVASILLALNALDEAKT